MSDDLGPGDVVEAVDPYGLRRAPHGQRFTVLRVFGPTDNCSCQSRARPTTLGPHGGLGLAGVPGRWCIYDFRKIGGSRADTVARFREDLGVRAPDLEVV